LINPLANEIKRFENLIIVPHKDLHFLPFQTLLSGPGRFLIEDHVISYAPSTAVLYYCLNENAAAGNNFLGVALGNLTVGTFPGLPGTELELDELSKLYPDMLSQRREGFSETFLKKNIHDKNYIHIATHGILNKAQPLYSYLLMSSSDQDDGRLTVNEIFGMDLQCKLITLSACETGLGDIGEGDDFIGLSRAFIYAGSASVIVSLWKVDDAMTAWIMVRFYQYIQHGYAAAEALALAQRDLIQRGIKTENKRGAVDEEMSREMMIAITTRNNETLKNPFYWAPFVLIGNGAIK
jgi:CHAT domain-containing protein